MTIDNNHLAELRANQRHLADLAARLRRLAGGPRCVSDLARHCHDAANTLNDAHAMLERLIREAAALPEPAFEEYQRPGPKTIRPPLELAGIVDELQAGPKEPTP